MSAKQIAINLKEMRSIIKKDAESQNSRGEVKKSTIAISRMGLKTVRIALSERDNEEYAHRYDEIIEKTPAHWADN